MLAGRQPDVDVGTERLRHFLAQQRADAAPGGAPDQFAGQEAECVDVIAVRRPRRPPWLLGRKRSGHRRPVELAARRHPPPKGRQPGLVAEQLADGDPGFSRRAELGPVPGDRRVGVQPALPDQLRGARRCHALADGEHVDQGVLAPLAGAGGVRPAAVQIGDHPGRAPRRRQLRRCLRDQRSSPRTRRAAPGTPDRSARRRAPPALDGPPCARQAPAALRCALQALVSSASLTTVFQLRDVAVTLSRFSRKLLVSLVSATPAGHHRNASAPLIQIRSGSKDIASIAAVTSGPGTADRKATKNLDGFSGPSGSGLRLMTSASSLAFLMTTLTSMPNSTVMRPAMARASACGCPVLLNTALPLCR